MRTDRSNGGACRSIRGRRRDGVWMRRAENPLVIPANAGIQLPFHAVKRRTEA